MLLQHRRAFANLIYVFDLLVLASAVVCGTVAVRGELPPAAGLAIEVLVGACAWTVLASRFDLYASRRTASVVPELVDLALGAVFCLVLMLFVRASLGGAAPGDIFVAVSIAMVAMLGTRLLVRAALALARRRGRNTRTVLFVGRGRTAQLMARDYCDHPQWGIIVLGELAFTQEQQRRGLESVASLGGVAELERVLREHAVDEVFVCPSEGVWASEVRSVLRFLAVAGLTCRVAPDFLGLPAGRTTIAMTGDVPTYTTHTGFGDPRLLAVKRLVDVIVAAGALVALAPFLVAIAVVIRLTSPGPALFRQTRLGLHGRPFTLLKFRSMVRDAQAQQARLASANEQTGPVFKMQCDPRVTRVGRVLRRYSLDELPQLFNVLRGDMSLVGPRPPLPVEVDQYDWWQRRRLSVRPGLTCIWQVSGRNAVSFDRWMELDMQYIDGWSLAMDLKIMAKTVAEVFAGGGA